MCDQSKSTFTLTFCERAENHVGMQAIGDMARDGFTVDELRQFHTDLTTRGVDATLVDLGGPTGDNAAVLVIRHGVGTILGDERGADALVAEHASLRPIWDVKALMRSRVVNKNARHNLCFADFSQPPNYERGQGTVVDFATVEHTRRVRELLPVFFGEKARGLFMEANYYYDVDRTYIGFHGDGERRRVIGVRLGQTLPLWFQWFHRCEKVGSMSRIDLHHGDVYVMSQKAVGTDWRKSSLHTLRHAAGFESTLVRAKAWK
jgi:hypothetical protein